MVGFQAKRRHPQPADCAGHAEVRVSSVAAKYENLAQNTVYMCLDSRSFVKFFAAGASGQVGCGTSRYAKLASSCLEREFWQHRRPLSIAACLFRHHEGWCMAA